MKISCSQSDLKTNLSLVSRAIPSRPTHPILANVLVVADADKGKVNLTGFDLNLGICTSFPAQIQQGGSVTLPAKLLNDIVGKLPDGEITITYDEDEMEDNPLVSILALSGKFQIRGMRGEDFPELPQVEKDEPFLLQVKSLKVGLQGSLFAASTDDTKQVLTGIHLTRSYDTLEFAATDGHRLSVVKTQDEEEIEEVEESDDSKEVDTENIEDSEDTEDMENSEDNENIEDSEDNEDIEDSEDNEDIEDSEDNEDNEDTENLDDDEEETSEENKEMGDFEITIPARALGELEKIFNMSKDNDSVALYVDDGQVVFELGEQRLTSRKLEGTYPNYNQLIPNQFKRTVVLARKTLISGLERVAVLSDQKNNMVKFLLEENQEQVTITVEAKELGSAKDSITAQITGEDLEIGFNIRYLIDGLKALPSDDIQFNLNEATQPVIITPLNGLKMTYLIMPVQIRD